MQEKSWTNIDRSKWLSGPWDNEPDKIQFVDTATGLPCLAVRHPTMGHWCGYVGVPPGHPLHGKGYDEVDVSVHGGLTFAAGCSPEENAGKGVCHIADPGEPDHVWWLGFDCAHAGDAGPKDRGMIHHEFFRNEYRTLDYVKDECASLASQLAEAA